jgi:hypothetical protein
MLYQLFLESTFFSDGKMGMMGCPNIYHLQTLMPATFAGTWEVQVTAGHPADAIVRTAEELDVDLIIMATHGRTGVPHIVLGSVAEKVVRHAPCPVLTVRQRKRGA